MHQHPAHKRQPGLTKTKNQNFFVCQIVHSTPFKSVVSYSSLPAQQTPPRFVLTNDWQLVFISISALQVRSSTSSIVIIQKRTTTCVSFQPFCSKWWCSGAIKNMRLPCPYLFLVYLKYDTCNITETASTTKHAPHNEQHDLLPYDHGNRT
jgi:hypothetical protein